MAVCVMAEVESWKDGFISSLFHRVGSQSQISQMPESALAVRLNVCTVVMHCFSDELQSSQLAPLQSLKIPRLLFMSFQ